MDAQLDLFRRISWDRTPFRQFRAGDVLTIDLDDVVLEGGVPCSVRLVAENPTTDQMGLWDKSRQSWDSLDGVEQAASGLIVAGHAKRAGNRVKFSFHQPHERGQLAWAFLADRFWLQSDSDRFKLTTADRILDAQLDLFRRMRWDSIPFRQFRAGDVLTIDLDDVLLEDGARCSVRLVAENPTADQMTLWDETKRSWGSLGDAKQAASGLITRGQAYRADKRVTFSFWQPHEDGGLAWAFSADTFWLQFDSGRLHG